jgi:hypothetical protein
MGPPGRGPAAHSQCGGRIKVRWRVRVSMPTSIISVGRTTAREAALAEDRQRIVTATPRRPLGWTHASDLGWETKPNTHGIYYGGGQGV